MTSQLVIFRAFLSPSPNPKSEKKIPVNQIIKKIWPSLEGDIPLYTLASNENKNKILRKKYNYIGNYTLWPFHVYNGPSKFIVSVH